MSNVYETINQLLQPRSLVGTRALLLAQRMRLMATLAATGRALSVEVADTTVYATGVEVGVREVGDFVGAIEAGVLYISVCQ